MCNLERLLYLEYGIGDGRTSLAGLIERWGMSQVVKLDQFALALLGVKPLHMKALHVDGYGNIQSSYCRGQHSLIQRTGQLRQPFGPEIPVAFDVGMCAARQNAEVDGNARG